MPSRKKFIADRPDPYAVASEIIAALEAIARQQDGWRRVYLKGRRGTKVAASEIKAIRSDCGYLAVEWAQAIAVPTCEAEALMLALEDHGDHGLAADVRFDIHAPLLAGYERAALKIVATAALADGDFESMVAAHWEMAEAYGLHELAA